MSRNIRDYAQAVREFRWDTPAWFNFGTDVVDHWAAHGDGTALVWANAAGDERRLRFSDVKRESDALAQALRARGLRKGDRVMLMLPRIPQWQVAMVACLKLGAVPIPCIEMLTAKDIDYRVRHSGARCAIARAEHAGKFDGLLDLLPVRVSVGDMTGWESMQSMMDGAAAGFEAEQVRAEDPALLYYTSGSTGNPKGVLHASRALHAWRYSAWSWLDLGPGDTIWCTADTGWSKAGTSILIGPWSMGACSFFYDGPFEAAKRLELLARHAVTVYCAPGTELYRLVDEDIASRELPALRHVVTAGESLNAIVAQRWAEASGVPVAEAYGQTESLMTLINPPALQSRPGSMGVAAPGCELAVIDAEGRRLPDGEEGDLALGMPNPQLMLGYWNDPERTAECYLEGVDGRWFVTGDRAARDADGWFQHRGRRDDVINSAGYRIGPSEVENALLDHPAVAECAAVGSPDRERGEIVKGFVVLRPGYDPGAALVAELQDHVKRITAPYKYPRAIEFVPDLPKTLTGKLRRTALRELERSRFREQQGGDRG